VGPAQDMKTRVPRRDVAGGHAGGRAGLEQGTRRSRRRVSRGLLAARIATWAAIAGLAVFLISFVAFAVDSWMFLGAEVFPGVHVGDADVGGIDVDAARGTLEDEAAGLADRPLPYTVDDQSGEVDATTVGLSFDVDATHAAASRVGRDGNPLARYADWVSARFGGGRRVEWVVSVDKAKTESFLAGLPFASKAEPVEPQVTFDGSSPQVTPGVDGTAIDAAAALPAIAVGFAGDSRDPLALPLAPVPPPHRDVEAQAAGDLAAQRMLQAPVTVVLGDRRVEVQPQDIARTLRPDITDSGYGIVVDQAKVVEVLRPSFADVGTAPVDAKFEVGAGGVKIVPGKEGVGCCGKDTAKRMQTAVLAQDPAGRTVTLQSGKVPPAVDSADLAALNVKSQLGIFTTEHPDGQPRVQNIHHIADLMRGKVVMAGQRFSVNEAIGERTEAGGWVMAPSINAGEHIKTPGGGISQFATTLYNALYFAGIKIEEHQPHTEYFDRYPKGREATMGWPKPDLIFTNDTPGAVMIWTAYNDTSITVAIWGTDDGRTVGALGPDISRDGNGCELVKTTRVITYADGRKVEEPFRQSYC